MGSLSRRIKRGIIHPSERRVAGKFRETVFAKGLAVGGVTPPPGDVTFSETRPAVSLSLMLPDGSKSSTTFGPETSPREAASSLIDGLSRNESRPHDHDFADQSSGEEQPPFLLVTGGPFTDLPVEVISTPEEARAAGFASGLHHILGAPAPLATIPAHNTSEVMRSLYESDPIALAAVASRAEQVPPAEETRPTVQTGRRSRMSMLQFAMILGALGMSLPPGGDRER